MWLKRFKNGTLSTILIVLILTSLLQMVVLWGDELKNFSVNIFGNTQGPSVEQLTLGTLFMPSAIYTGRGIDQPKYMLNSGGFETVWNDSKRYLEQIFSNTKVSNTNSSRYTAEEWRKIVSKKGFYLTFPFDIEPDFLRCFINCNSEFSYIKDGIRAMMVLPWDNINPDLINIYIRTAYNIYKFTLEISDIEERRVIYDIIQSEYEVANGVKYRIISDVFPMESFEFEINETLLISNDEDESESIKGINFYNSLKLQNDISDEGYAAEVAKKISNDNEINYITTKNSEDTVTLKNINNIYRYYKEGILEYNYISSSSENKQVDQSTMISAVIAQINSFSTFIDIQKIFLSDQESDNGIYTFKFNYSINEKAVAIEMPFSDSKAMDLIEIVTDGVDIISYRIVPLTIDSTNERISQSLNFISLLDRLYSSIDEYKDFSFKSYRDVYLVSKFDAATPIFPEWQMISYKNVRYYAEKVVK